MSVGARDEFPERPPNVVPRLVPSLLAGLLISGGVIAVSGTNSLQQWRDRPFEGDALNYANMTVFFAAGPSASRCDVVGSHAGRILVPWVASRFLQKRDLEWVLTEGSFSCFGLGDRCAGRVPKYTEPERRLAQRIVTIYERLNLAAAVGAVLVITLLLVDNGAGLFLTAVVQVLTALCFHLFRLAMLWSPMVDQFSLFVFLVGFFSVTRRWVVAASVTAAVGWFVRESTVFLLFPLAYACWRGRIWRSGSTLIALAGVGFGAIAFRLLFPYPFVGRSMTIASSEWIAPYACGAAGGTFGDLVDLLTFNLRRLFLSAGMLPLPAPAIMILMPFQVVGVLALAALVRVGDFLRFLRAHGEYSWLLAGVLLVGLHIDRYFWFALPAFAVFFGVAHKSEPRRFHIAFPVLVAVQAWLMMPWLWSTKLRHVHPMAMQTEFMDKVFYTERFWTLVAGGVVVALVEAYRRSLGDRPSDQVP